MDWLNGLSRVARNFKLGSRRQRGFEPVTSSACMASYMNEWTFCQFEWYRDNKDFITVSSVGLGRFFLYKINNLIRETS